MFLCLIVFWFNVSSMEEFVGEFCRDFDGKVPANREFKLFFKCCNGVKISCVYHYATESVSRDKFTMIFRKLQILRHHSTL